MIYAIGVSHMGAALLYNDLDNVRLLRDMPVMQYTGLKDTNGKEIYEGDILGFVHPKRLKGKPQYVVKWSELSAGFDPVITNGEFEVIGNIYENLVDDL